MPRRRKVGEQLDLLQDIDPHEPWWRCEGIFTLNYLKRQITDSQHVPPASDIAGLYHEVKSRWAENYAGLRRRNEAYTRTCFLDPTLTNLGWHFIPENALPEGSTRKRPDYCLFLDQETQRRVAAGDAIDIFRASATALEAKKTQHPLDQVSRTETPGWFPSQQIQDYLRCATDETGKRFFRWAVLSNGNEWRLYCWDAAPDSFFAFHLAHDDQFCSIEEFRLFYALFHPRAFSRSEEGRCLLDDFREESLTQQIELEKSLRRRVFDVLEDLAEGFYKNPANALGEQDLAAVYATSLIVLYRLLFILYAESRGLLPAKPHGPGSNRRYRNEFSLVRLIDRLRDTNNYCDDAFDGLYCELLKLFQIIDGGNPQQNARLGVTRYNGRLFSAAQHPTIEMWRVGEKTLANVLRQLIFAQPPSRPRERQHAISTTDTIDYTTLEVRQLGDIYEGLLGGRLRVRSDDGLELVNERGENQRQGMFYTPDWVVQYLVREAISPLLDEIDSSPEVQTARNARSMEKRCDNSYAYRVLALNIVDPAMGSGHFLVRTTEYLAQAIFHHPTTRRMTEPIVAQGQLRRSREEIESDARIPVPPGISQEQAEVGYWRRRVVEACIYGVDTNPLAVELAKLSLWLTCIAIDEPLNFLDHHLRCGNALLGANPTEMRRLPYLNEEQAREGFFDVGNRLTRTLADVIEETVGIETLASTEMEVVKVKERRWREARDKVRPFLDVGDVWLAALDGLPINHLDYRRLAMTTIDPEPATTEQKADAAAIYRSIEESLLQKRLALQPFHWQLEFPEVFFSTDGRSLPASQCGFDAVLGNPPYVSTHTSAEQCWRTSLERSVGYLEDLYVHFTDQGFRLLRVGGRIGFIVSDTFFTLATKQKMRELLQENQLTHLGQCDPFDATVDAALFVARKAPANDTEPVLFVQARHATNNSRPEKEMESLEPIAELRVDGDPDDIGVRHTTRGCLRLHLAPMSIYRNAMKRAFFEPCRPALVLYRLFNEPLKRLVADWWDKIETSQKFADNLAAIKEYHKTLSPADVTLVGLVTSGGQGLATANNARFLGYLAGTRQAEAIKDRRAELTRRWLENGMIRQEFLRLLIENGGDPQRPTADAAAWEACIEPLKTQFDAGRELGFQQTDLYRIVPPRAVAADEDFQFAWRRRKCELLRQWQAEQQLQGFWREADLLVGGQGIRGDLRNAADLPDDVFCRLCEELLTWWGAENNRRENSRPRQARVPRAVLGLRSSEKYADPVDAPRVAVAYNGLSGRAHWMPFRKGDPHGHRWLDDEPLFIDWTAENVTWLFANSGRRGRNMPVVRNPDLYLLGGVSWTRGANHVPIKARLQPNCVFDVNGLRLTPLNEEIISAKSFLAVANSDVFSFFLKKFIAHTWMAQISDLRMMPLVLPSRRQAACLDRLTSAAMEAKRLEFAGDTPPNELVAYVQRLIQSLRADAPQYLKPHAQQRLLETPAHCLAVIELAINREVEKLYGLEGMGPFDEF